MNCAGRARIALAGALSAFACLAPAAAQDAAGDGVPIADLKASTQEAGVAAVGSRTEPLLTGSFSVRGRDRWTAHEADIDVYSTLSFTLRPHEDVELYFSGDLYADVSEDEDRPAVLIDLYETYDGDVQGNVREAYLRLTGLPHLDLRLGRQLTQLGRMVHFDGASAAYQLLPELRLRALGGVPVFRHKSPWRGDVVGGGALDFTPSAWTRLSVEYLHVHEDVPRVTGFRYDDLIAVSGSQLVGGVLQLRARGEVLDFEMRSAEGGLTLNVASLGLQVHGRYYVLLKSQREDTTGLDPFTDLLGPERAHQLVTASASKTLGDHAALEVFYAYRRVTDRGDVDLSNHDFHRYGATFSLYDVLTKGLGGSVTVERWDVTTRGGSDTEQLSGEVGYRGEVVRVHLGSSYQLYRYDAFTDRQREHVRTYYARLRLRLGAHTLDGSYSFEHAELGDFHVARVGYRYDF